LEFSKAACPGGLAGLCFLCITAFTRIMGLAFTPSTKSD
jgi:hypothetical protein